MPQASEELRAYWARLANPSALYAAQIALDDEKVKHDCGVISLEKNKEYSPHINRAVEFLMDQWDWDVKYID